MDFYKCIYINTFIAKGAEVKDKPQVFFKSRQEVEKDCKEWAKEIERDFKPDIIVFIAKSGFLFALPLAEYFGCPMADITVSRPGNNGKDIIRRLVPSIPGWLLKMLLRSKANYSYQERNSGREVQISGRFGRVDWEKYKRILIVDDSTDTGWSMITARDAVIRAAGDADVKTLSYCCIDISEKRIQVDYARYKNTIIISAASRYSKEYAGFIDSLDNWKSNF